MEWVVVSCVSGARGPCSPAAHKGNPFAHLSTLEEPHRTGGAGALSYVAIERENKVRKKKENLKSEFEFRV